MHEKLAHAIIWRNHIRQLRTSLLDSTDDREDATPATRWNGSGVEHVHALFSGRAALRLRIRIARLTLAIETPTRRAIGFAVSRIHQLADRSFIVVGQFSSAQRQSFVVVVDVSRSFRWSAVLHRLEQQSFASEMVFTNVNRICARSVLSLLSL